MNTAPSRAIFDSIFRGKAPGLSEFGALLQYISTPAVLISTQKEVIAAVNSGVMKLTAFSQAELLGKPYEVLFNKPINRVFSVGGDHFITVNRSKRPAVTIKTRVVLLEGGNGWVLVLLSPGDESEDMVFGESEMILQAAAELMASDRLESIDLNLERKLQLLENVLRTNVVCLYQAGTGSPELIKIKTRESREIFPERLPSTDLIRLNEPFIWTPAKKVLTELHQKGRAESLLYIASVPIGDKGALSGLVVAGDYVREPIGYLIPILKLLANSIGSGIQQYLKAKNFQETVNRQQKLMDIYSLGIEHAREGIVVLKPDLSVLQINPSAEWMLGYSNSEVQGQPVDNILIGSERLIPAFESSLQNIPTLNMGSITLNRRNGQSFPASMQIIPVQKNDALSAVLVFLSDVSEHELIQARTQQLEHRALLGDFTNVFAHEVRNPINNISTGIQLIASRIDENDPNKEVIDRIQNDCLRLNSLMESVLAFSRPVPRHLAAVDLNLMLSQMIGRWYPRMAKVNVTSYFQPNPEIPKVEGDWRSLEQVFTNLISNAVEAMEKTGGTLAIKLDETRIPGGEGMVEIKISDTGPGIPAEIRAKIFEPFVTTKQNGTGLGLAIIKRIVIAHRGNIDVESFPGGTVFRVTLPVYNGENA
jgi:two-component system sensor histidine kinase AtoS